MATTREKNKKTHRKAHCVAVLAVLIAAGVCMAGLFGWNQWKKGQENQERSAIYLKDGISIESVDAYDGPFWEDGTDRAVEDVWQLTVLNTSEQDIQYLKIIARDENGTTLGEFEITTLTSESTVQVLEANAAQRPENDQMCTYTIENLAFLQQERSLHTELFTLSVADQWIRLENHSGEDVTNDIYVYYKRVEDGVLKGGITYRAKFEGGLAAGESREEQTRHFDPDTCEIMYLTYQ